MKTRLLSSIALAVLAVSSAGAQPVAPDGALPIDTLKRVYLQCDRWSTQQRLDATTAAHCSVVGDALLRRGFDGDLDRLLAWWRVARQRSANEALASSDSAPTP